MLLSYLVKKHYVQAAVAGMHYIVFVLVTFAKHNCYSTLVKRHQLHGRTRSQAAEGLDDHMIGQWSHDWSMKSNLDPTELR